MKKQVVQLVVALKTVKCNECHITVTKHAGLAKWRNFFSVRMKTLLIE